MVLEDFDIEQSSSAVGKPVIKTFQTTTTTTKPLSPKQVGVG